MRKIIIVLSLLSLSLLAQCGLERPLAPFDAPTFNETVGTTYKFNTGYDNFTDSTRYFLGYEVYYRIQNYKNTDFPINLLDPAVLATNNFKRLYLSSDTWRPSLNISDKPNIKTDYGLVHTPDIITIDFSTITSVTASSSISIFSPPIELRRPIQLDVSQSDPEYGHYRKFSEFLPGDEDFDLTSIGDPNLKRKGTFQVNIGIYVYAFGKSIATDSIWTTITSPMQWLGYNTITVVYDDGLPG